MRAVEGHAAPTGARPGFQKRRLNGVVRRHARSRTVPGPLRSLWRLDNFKFDSLASREVTATLAALRLCRSSARSIENRDLASRLRYGSFLIARKIACVVRTRTDNFVKDCAGAKCCPALAQRKNRYENNSLFDRVRRMSRSRLYRMLDAKRNHDNHAQHIGDSCGNGNPSRKHAAHRRLRFGWIERVLGKAKIWRLTAAVTDVRQQPGIQIVQGSAGRLEL